MKTTTALFVLLMTLGSHVAFAQDNQETLLGSGTVAFGGYGAPVLKFSSIRGEPGILLGGMGAFMIGHQFAIGAGGFGLVNNVPAAKVAQDAYSPYEDLFVNFGYGGGILEYTWAPSKLVHFTVGTLIGAGGVDYRYDIYEDDWDNNHDTPNVRTETVFVIEPSIGAELNITEWMRANLGVSYRHVNGLDVIKGLENKDLSGVSGMLTFKFGKF